MSDSPLTVAVVFTIGPVPVTLPVVTTWGLMAVMAVASALLTHRLSPAGGGRRQTVLELTVLTIAGQVSDAMQTDGRRYLPLLGTLFLYLAVANLSGLLPGVHPPTASLETAAALALVVFAATQFYGVRGRGVRGYMAGFAHPTVLMLPLNLLGEVTRAFSLMVRLFGNVMSGEFVIGIVLALAGLFVPVPLMLLETLTGLVQAYIFTILAAVFIAGAAGTIERG
ncbi:F-type H+-transporting ATPase subunit a [Azospirillum fermentarium]|uniref:F0F1 ATP synthase subunit A n=1 Tax=Azospirillum fermentarium TaxID=1233114 RepID=UPI0022279B30|nr:F0F1 ATP synthase subunit A [Azospirillum fermentarium]MCW2249116.1 F-type H+-transporting ATPase subunit a [Azospirillum fermentarium]